MAANKDRVGEQWVKLIHQRVGISESNARSMIYGSEDGDKVQRDAIVGDLGLDSLGYLELTGALDEQWGVKLNDQQVDEVRDWTLGQLMDYTQQHQTK